jgi:hypothetical protein
MLDKTWFNQNRIGGETNDASKTIQIIFDSFLFKWDTAQQLTGSSSISFFQIKISFLK